MPIDPATSTIIQRELKYSMEIALLILPFLQSTWLAGQQHPAQFEHRSGVEQFSHEVSVHPQAPHEDTVIGMRDEFAGDRRALSTWLLIKRLWTRRRGAIMLPSLCGQTERVESPSGPRGRMDPRILFTSSCLSSPTLNRSPDIFTEGGRSAAKQSFQGQGVPPESIGIIVSEHLLEGIQLVAT